MTREPTYLPLRRLQRAEQRAKRIAQARFVLLCLLAAILLLLLAQYPAQGATALCRTGFQVTGARPGCTVEYWQDCNLHYTRGWDKAFRVTCPDHVMHVRLAPAFETRPPVNRRGGRCWEQAFNRWGCFVDYAMGLRPGTAQCPRFPYDGCGRFVR